MDDESAKIIGFFITYVIGGIVLGFIAAHKNRSYWAWGVIGGLFWFPCIIALVLLPPLCIKCQRPLTRDEASRGACPSCGTQAKKHPSEQEGYALLEKAT